MQNTEPRTREKRKPKIPSVAVIGCGQWGKNLVRNFAALGSLQVVCESTSRGQQRARRFSPDVRCVSDLGEVLELREELGGVVIATPAETHYVLAKTFLKAGMNVLVEKPLALSYREGKELVDLAADRGRILMVGHVMEYHPAIVRLVEVIGSKELGDIQYIYSNRLNLGKIRQEENILWSFAPHDVAIILRILKDVPVQVTAVGGCFVQPNVADVTLTSMLFDNGVRAHIYVSWLHPFRERRLVVVGSEKMASFDDVSKKLLLYDQKVEIEDGQPVPKKGEAEEIEFSAHEPLELECEAYLEAIRTGKPPLTDGESGLRVLQVLSAAQKSLGLNGQPVPSSIGYSPHD